MPVVLVVEDEEQVRVLAESVLRDAGHTVIAATGADGSQALLDTQQPVDVLFVDINLGNDNEAGLKIAQSAREARPKLSILYTTGSGIDDGMKAMFTEPCLFLPKSYTTEQLTNSISFLLMNANPPKPPKMLL